MRLNTFTKDFFSFPLSCFLLPTSRLLKERDYFAHWYKVLKLDSGLYDHF